MPINKHRETNRSTGQSIQEKNCINNYKFKQRKWKWTNGQDSHTSYLMVPLPIVDRGISTSEFNMGLGYTIRSRTAKIHIKHLSHRKKLVKERYTKLRILLKFL